MVSRNRRAVFSVVCRGRVPARIVLSELGRIAFYQPAEVLCRNSASRLFRVYRFFYCVVCRPSRIERIWGKIVNGMEIRRRLIIKIRCVDDDRMAGSIVESFITCKIHGGIPEIFRGYLVFLQWRDCSMTRISTEKRAVCDSRAVSARIPYINSIPFSLT